MAITVRLSGLYKLERLEAMIESLTPLLTLKRRTNVELDMSGLVGVGPGSLSLLTAAVKVAVHQGVMGNGSLLVPPRSRSPRNYLLRMDFLRVLMGDEYLEAGEPFRRRLPVGFRPCSEFERPEEARAVASALSGALGEACMTERVAAAALDIALLELTENVLQHGDAPAGGFAAAQAWPRKGMFEISVVDLGIGIRSSLAKNPAYGGIPDDVTAITAALDAYVTSTPDRNSGIGLFITRLLLRENGGLLFVRSGKGAVYAGDEEHRETRPLNFPGTLVVLRAHTDRPLDINRVYDMLRPPDADAHDD